MCRVEATNTYIFNKTCIGVETSTSKLYGFLFFDMNYKNIYNKIIQNRLQNPITTDEYKEKHHIIPKCLGGSDLESNLIYLTAREHFICHALLAEMYEKKTNEWYKMNHAFIMMKPSSIYNKNRYFNSRIYELKKKDFSETMSNLQGGEKNSQYGKVWIHNTKLEKNIKINKSELESYLQDGWYSGRIFDFKKIKSKKTISKYNDRVLTDKLLKNIESTFGVKENDKIKTILKLKEILYEQYVIFNMSTTQLAIYYNSTDPTIRQYLIWLGIGTKNRAGKWANTKFN